MPENLRFSNPDAIAKPPGYTHVVEVIGPGRLVYFAGQLGLDRSGKMGGDIREQIELAFQNLKAALASVGVGFDHLVKINNYIVDIGKNIGHFREIRDSISTPRRRRAPRSACRSWRGPALCSKSRASRSCRRSDGGRRPG